MTDNGRPAYHGDADLLKRVDETAFDRDDDRATDSDRLFHDLADHIQSQARAIAALITARDTYKKRAHAAEATLVPGRAYSDALDMYDRNL